MNRSPLTPARRLARRGCFALRPLSAAALLMLAEGALAQAALPSTGHVVYGNVSTTQPDASTLHIQQGSTKAYVQYDSFSIGAGNKVVISQPTATSTFVGQVTGYDPSFILGQLQANGRVFLVNPNGIVFGEHARVDVGSLVATTLSLSLNDFLNDRILLTSNPTEGRGDLKGVVRNDGTITAKNGFVVLAGHQVINTGQILAENGRVGLAAASKLLVDVEGDGLLFFEVEGQEAGARLAQLGRIQADGGSVELMAASRSQFADTVLNMSGVVQARGLGIRQGRVVIDGGDSGVTEVSGTVDTTGLDAGQKGGDITVTGDRVLVRDTALLDASGAAGGGRLLVGGDFHGANPGVRNAQVTVVGSGARLKANALQNGDGGDVVVWADDTTRLQGSIESKGGAQGGNGGAVEVSGKVSLAYKGSVDTSAPKGKLGSLLLDPRDITITAASGTTIDWTAAAAIAAPGDAEVDVASINAAVADVTLAATRDASVEAAINIANAGTGLSITAGRDLTVAQSVTTTNGAVQLSSTGGVLKLNNDINAGTGNVTLTGPVTLGGAGGTRSLTGGAVSVGAVTGGGKNLTLAGSTSATLSGTVTGVAALDASASATTAINADVTTTGTQGYGVVTLGGAGTTRTLSGTAVTLGAVDGGGKSLTLTATTAATLTGAVSHVNALNASGATALSVGADVSTSGAQTYGGTVTLTAASTFTGSSVGFNNLAAAANNVGIHANAITVSGAATGTGTLNLAPSTDAGTIGVNSATASTLAINDALLAKFSGFSTLIIGTSTGTGNIAFGNTTLPFNTLVRSASGNVDFAKVDGAHSLGVQTTGTISLNDLIGGTTALSSLDLNGPVTINTSLVKTSGNQTYGDTVTLANAEVSLEAGAGKILLTSVDGGGANDLTLKSANAAADAIKTTGTIGSLGVLDVQGKSTLGGNVTTTGKQTYGDTTTLAANVTLDAGADKVVLADVVGANHDLTLKSTNAAADAIQTTAAISGVGALSVQGQATLGANVTTTGAQDYQGAVALAGPVTVNSNGANVRFRDKVDGAQALTVNAGAGNARFDGAVGGDTALTSLGVTAASVDLNGGAVTTTGTQTYTASTVNLNHTGGTTFTASGLTVTGHLAAGAHDLSVFADALSVSGNITSTGAGKASIAARQAATSIGVAGGAGAFQVSSALLNKFASFGSVTVGRTDGTGTITFGNLTGGAALNRSLNVRNGSGNVTFGQIDTTVDGAYDLDVATTGGTVALNDTVGNIGRLNKLTVDGPTTLGTPLVYTAGAQQYKGAVTLTNDVAAVGSGVTFDSTVTGATHDLGVQSTNGGEKAHFLGAVNVRSLLVYGGAEVGANVTTSQGQTYNGGVTLSNAVTFTGLQLTFNNGLAAGAHNLGLLTDGLSVSGALSGTGVAQLGAYTASRDTVVGASGNVGDLVIDASTFSQFSTFSGLTVGRADGTGTITLGTSGGSFALPTNLTLLSGSGDINVLSSLSGARSLALNTSGTTTIAANVSGLSSLSTDAGGTTRLGASVSTSGAQTYGDAVVLDNSVGLSASTVNFGDTVNGASAGGQSLGITGPAHFTQAVGGSQALSSVNVSGASQFDHGGARTTGSQVYSGAVTLGDDSTFTSSNAFVRFENTVTGPHALTATTAIGTVFFNAVDVASVHITAGLSYLYGGSVTTTGAQTYAGNSQLGANNTLTGTHIGFGGTVDGNQSLSINASGTATLGGAVGASSALTSLSTSGATHLDGGSVRTSGAQSYGGAVTLGANTTVTANTVDFNGTVDGARALVVNDSGTTTFHGDVGGNTALTSLTTTVGGSTVLPAQVTTTGAQTYGDAVTLAANTTLSANSVSLAALVGANHALAIATPGLVDLNGSLTGLTSLIKTGAGTTRFIGAPGLSTTGAQSYAGDVQVSSGAATFDGSALTFSGDLTGANNLALAGDAINVVGNVTGTGTFSIAPKSVGTTIGLSGGTGALQVDLNKVSGFTQRVIGRTDGTGAINVGATNLTADTTLQSGTGQVHFQSTIDGAHALTVNTAGETRFQGDVGAGAALASITTDAPGTTRIDASLMRTTGAQTYNDLVTTSGVLSLVASTVTLHTAGDLALGVVNLGLGGHISTDRVLTLSDSLTLGGGTLVLAAGAGPGPGGNFNDPELAARPGLVSGNRVLKEAAAAIQQTGGVVTTAAGSTLDLQAANRGSILLDHTSNEIGGDLKAVSGPVGDTDASRFAGAGNLPLSFVRVDSTQIHAAGIEADAVKLTANTLTTAAGTKIRARLPYINAQGIESSVAALTLVLKQPNVLNQFGTQASSSWIQVDLGDQQGGYLTVRPKGAGAGSSAVYLGGSDANLPFYDGTSKASEIQVYFNGRVPSTPQEVGALSAVTAVIEESRRARFDEAVRTENVSSRLRTGVIAEVGSGRPATEGAESIRMPASCTPTATLGCQ